MKYAWRALIVIGALLVLSALMMKTTVNGIYNLGLLQQQQLFLILGCALLLGGIGLYAVKKLKQTKEEDEEEARRGRAAQEAREQATSQALERMARAEQRAGTALSRLNPGTDAALARLLVGIVVGGIWSLLLVSMPAGATGTGWKATAFLSALVFSFWRLPAGTAIRRLMLTNAVLLSLSASVVLERTAGNEEFRLAAYLATVATLVGASLATFFLLRRRNQVEEAPERKGIPFRKGHVLSGAAVLLGLSLLIPPYELTDFAEGGVQVTRTQYVRYGSTKEDLRGGLLMIQLVLLYCASSWLYMRAKA